MPDIRFIIQTNPAEAHLHGPNTMFWTEDGIRGPIEAHLTATRYDDRAEAEEAFEAIPANIRRFYGLAVIPEPRWILPGYRSAPFGTQGWMKGHPGYDLH